MNTILFYRSQYGSTKQYAEWIQDELGCTMDSFDKMNSYEMADYDLIIMGESVYAGQMKSPKTLAKIVEKYPDKDYIFFMVGVADMEDEGNREKLYGDLARTMGASVEKVDVFFFRGDLDYTKMGRVHKTMMWMLTKRLKSMKEEDLPKDADQLIASYGKKTEFLDPKYIVPLIDHVRKLEEREASE